jgi:protein O-GlcNAc transferase
MDSRPLIAQALGLHQRGQLDQAAELYLQLLQAEPGNFAGLQLLGVLRGQQGRTLEARKLLEDALELQPRDFGALCNYGQILMGAGQYPQARDAFDRALDAKPDFFEALYNRGIALAHLQDYGQAVASYDKALALNPGNPACLYNRGISLAALGRHEDALASYDKALALTPNFASAWDNRGNALCDMGKAAQALESYDKAIALAPDNFRAHYNRGNVLCELGHSEQAVESYDRALAIQPHFSEAVSSRAIALVNRAFLYQQQGRFDAALADYDRAITSQPENARAWNGRGSVLHALRRNAEALTQFDKAVELDPSYADALTNRAHLRWSGHGDYGGATSDLKAALIQNPEQPYALGELLHLKMYGADWENFDAEVAAIDQAVRQGRPVVRPFVYQAISRIPADLQACSRIFATDLFSTRPAQTSAFPYRHEKIRIGYVSGEFREQATAYLMAGLYELHDREKFEVIAIDSGGGDGSAMRRRLEASFDKIIPIAQMDDDAAVMRVRREEIDILVNLNGYFGSPRMGLFARRAAPIQVNYLGFPATLGASTIDYILADRVVIPPAERCFYDEQVVYLPHCYQVNDRKRAIAEHVPPRAALGLPENSFVFCNFNQSYKITPAHFSSWMRILCAVPDSVLWLLDSKPPFQANLSRTAQQHGVAPERLVFAPSLPPDQHLARLKQANLFLDTLPYNAHTTASDALWAGLPLLTCRGTTFPGRVAASLLEAVGMSELVTESLESYEARALALARDRASMSQLKDKLGRNRLTFPLFDTDLFRKNIESAYTVMWRAWKNGGDPSSFSA